MLNYPPSIDAVVLSEGNGTAKNVFNLVVTKRFLEDNTSIKVYISRTVEEFQDNLQYLNKNLGLLKSFSFSKSSFSHFVSERYDHKTLDINHVKAYLQELSVLNPIPSVVVSFLGLDNVTAYQDKLTESANRTSLQDTLITSDENDNRTSAINISDSTLCQESTSAKSAVKNDSPHSIRPRSIHLTDISRNNLHYRKHRHSHRYSAHSFSGTSSLDKTALHTARDIVILWKCLCISYGLAIIHLLVILFWKGFHILQNCNLVIIWNKFVASIDSFFTYVKFAVEICVLTFLLSTVIHKIFGKLVSRYFQRKLCTAIDGRYNFNFEYISIRLAIDKNQIIFTNFEWKNPSYFDQTPYFIHIDEIRITFLLISVYDAIVKNKAIKVSEIKLTNCHVYIEKKKRELPLEGKDEYSVNMYAAVGKHDYCDIMASNTNNVLPQPTAGVSTTQPSQNIPSTVTAGKSKYDMMFNNSNKSYYTTTANADSSSTTRFPVMPAGHRMLTSYLTNSSGDTGSGKLCKYTGGTGGDGRASSADKHDMNRAKAGSMTHAISQNQFSFKRSNTANDVVKSSGGVSSNRMSETLLQDLAFANSPQTQSHAQDSGIRRRHSGSNVNNVDTSNQLVGNSKHNNVMSQSAEKCRDTLQSESIEGKIVKSTSNLSLNSVDSFSDIHPSPSPAVKTRDSFTLEEDMAERHAEVGIDGFSREQLGNYDQFEVTDREGTAVTSSETIKPNVPIGESEDSLFKRRSKIFFKQSMSQVSEPQQQQQQQSQTTPIETSREKNSRIFGFPYKVDIAQLVVTDLQMHIQDLLNASHVDHSQSGMIQLSNMVMTHDDLTRISSYGNRKGIYLDEVMWRTINHVMSELLKTNKVTLLSIFASAAANQTAAAVKGLARYLFKGGS